MEALWSQWSDLRPKEAWLWERKWNGETAWTRVKRQVREDGGASCRERQGTAVCCGEDSAQEGGAPRLQMSRS